MPHYRCSYFFRSKKGAVLLRFYRSAWLDHLLYNGSVLIWVLCFHLFIATLCLTIMARIFCCGTLYACDSLSAFRYLSARARSRNFFTRHIIFLRMTEHFPPQRVLKPLRWRVPSCSVSYSGLASRRVCLIC